MREDGTQGTILSLLRQGRRQAQELAATLEIDTSAVRRHLETLRNDGLVDTEDIVAGPGRPKRMYGLTEEGREQFPRDYALLLDLIINKMSATYGHAALDELVAGIAKDVAKKVDGDAPFKVRLDALVDLYNELGFDASVEQSPSGVVLVQRNCIFLKTATANPELLCQCFDEGIIRSALHPVKVELECSLATGSPHCRHHITPTADAPIRARGSG